MSMLFVIGCGNSSIGRPTTMIKVDLQVPEEAKVNEVTTISARVTQNDTAVNNAEKVEFELWLDETDHEKITGKLLQDGTYQIDKKFGKAGTYFVICHVTARSMHAMPKKKFQVKRINNLGTS